MSEILAAMCLDAGLEHGIIIVDIDEVIANAVHGLLYVIAGGSHAVYVLVLGRFAQVDHVAVEVAHVPVFHSRLANLDLVRVRERFVHPLVLEAVGSCVFHCLVAHVL